MSGQGDDPFDPFGQNERTIIRPRPGAARAPQPAPPPIHRSGTNAPGMANDPMPSQPLQPAPRMQAARAPAVPLVSTSDNPFLAAAAPLLDLLGRLRNNLTQADFTDLKLSVSRAIEQFEQEAIGRGADIRQVPMAKYAIAATADDIVQNLPGAGREVWTQDPMLGRYFGERIGGTRFFEHLDTLMRNPGAAYHLLELKHACLALGFEGMHRTTPNGQSELQRTRRDVYQALRGVASGGGWALSPSWQGMELERKSIGRQVPFWAVAAFAGVALAALFFALRSLLAGETAALADEVRALHPTYDIQIAREQFQAPPPPPPAPPPGDDGQLDRIREALGPEIAAAQIEAEYLDANYIIVRLPNTLLFPSGKASVSEAFRTGLASRIGAVFRHEADLLRAKGFRHGAVIARGHSDAEPLSPTSRWGSNYELSEARAQSVIDAITPYAPPELPVSVEGKGPDDPVCTPASDRSCWPQNRRVELLIERTL